MFNATNKIREASINLIVDGVDMVDVVHGVEVVDPPADAGVAPQLKGKVFPDHHALLFVNFCCCNIQSIKKCFNPPNKNIFSSKITWSFPPGWSYSLLTGFLLLQLPPFCL